MRYEVRHSTTYAYNDTVSLCHNLAVLTPRETKAQQCHAFRLDISPVPEIIEEHKDFFGNCVYYFVIEQDHETLTVTSTSIVERQLPPWKMQPPSDEAWESVRDWLHRSNGNMIDVRQFAFPTPVTNPSDSIRDYAAASFAEGRPLFEAVRDLVRRIHTDFTYSSGFTTISTPLSEVLEEKKGVCQDFAHLAISCIQSMGLAARYVSGYLETQAAPGKKKLKGADASHAWFAVYIPQMGWVDFDPTNNKNPDDQYITIGWGRNYFDIVPLKGVIMSSDRHELKVAVDVTRIGNP